LQIFDVHELSTQGGSLRVFAQLSTSNRHALSESVERILEDEKNSGMLKIDFYEKFHKQCEYLKYQFVDFLIKAKRENKKVIGYGAAAKGNTLLNYCGIRTDYLDYVVDASPHKQGLYLPGTHIPICEPSKIIDTKPDYILILPWNISSEVIAQNEHIRKWGGKFIVAIPELRIF